MELVLLLLFLGEQQEGVPKAMTTRQAVLASVVDSTHVELSEAFSLISHFFVSASMIRDIAPPHWGWWKCVFIRGE
ncbi:hypothetical protein BDQ17DRAFT_1361544 [Cyathus striatus]|nr:hypothetical protein BDQ17DRAFT_1361544 [Cyathus striatus]